MVLGLTERLVAQSLVVAEDQGYQTRYGLLETIRQYGEERAAEAGGTDELHHRHAEYYIVLVADLTERLTGPDQIDCGRRLSAEHENLLAAIGFAIDTNDADTALRLIRAAPFTPAQTGFELRLPIESALTLREAPDHPDYPFALAVAAGRAALRGDGDLAAELLSKALDAHAHVPGDPDPLIEVMPFFVRGNIAMSRGDFSETAAILVEVAGINRAAGKIGSAATNLGAAASSYALAGEIDMAVGFASEGMALARQSGMPTAIAINLAALASALAEREPERGRDLVRENMNQRARLGYNNLGELTQVALVAGRLRDWPLALELAADAIPLLHWAGFRPQLSGVLNLVSRALVDDDPHAAAVLQGAARRLVTAQPPPPSQLPQAQSSDSAIGLIPTLRREATMLLRDSLGDTVLRQRRTDGEAMNEDQAVTYALDAIERATQKQRLESA